MSETHSEYAASIILCATANYLGFTQWCRDWQGRERRINPLFQAVREDEYYVVCFLMERPEIYWSLFPYINDQGVDHIMINAPSYLDVAEEAALRHSIDSLKYLVASMLKSTKVKNDPGRTLLSCAFNNDKECLECVRYLLSVPEFSPVQKHYDACTLCYPDNVDLLRILLQDQRVDPFATTDHYFERSFLDDRVSLDLIELVYSDPRFELVVMQNIYDKYQHADINPKIFDIIKKEIDIRSKEKM